VTAQAVRSHVAGGLGWMESACGHQCVDEGQHGWEFPAGVAGGEGEAGRVAEPVEDPGDR
jgi:hypothetical protein